MQILKKNILNITNNNFDNYQIYLKNLNFLNKLKKKKKIFLKDTFLLKLKEFYLLNLNLKENYFVENLNLDYKKKENLLYIVTDIDNKNDILINLNIINHFILNLYTFLLLNKIKKYKIKKYIIKTNNFNNQEIYYKKSKNIFSYFKGKIIKFKKYKKKIDKKYFIINHFSLIKEVKSYYLYKKKKFNLIKNPFLRRKYKKKMRLKNIFKKYKKKNKNFKINNNNIFFKFNSSRKNFVYDFNKKNKINNLKKNFKLYNLKNYLNYLKIVIKK